MPDIKITNLKEYIVFEGYSIGNYLNKRHYYLNKHETDQKYNNILLSDNCSLRTHHCRYGLLSLELLRWSVLCNNSIYNFLCIS